jgi:hypothetical protein
MDSLKNELKMAIRENDVEKVRNLSEEIADANQDMKEFYDIADMLNRTKQRRGHFDKVKALLWQYI